MLLWGSEIPGGSISSDQGGWESSQHCCRFLPPALAILLPRCHTPHSHPLRPHQEVQQCSPHTLAPHTLTNTQIKQATMRTCVKLSPVHSTAPQALFLLHLPGSAPLCRESHLCPLNCISRLQCSSHPPPRSTSLHGPQLSSFSPYSLCSNFAHSLPSQPERRFTEPYSSPFPTTPTSPSRSLLAAGQRLSLPFFPAPIERTTALRPVALQALLSLTHRFCCRDPTLQCAGLGSFKILQFKGCLTMGHERCVSPSLSPIPSQVGCTRAACQAGHLSVTLVPMEGPLRITLDYLSVQQAINPNV